MRDKIIDDLTGMVGGAAGILADIREQVRGDVRDRLRHAADRIDLATRDDLLALEGRIAALEAAIARLEKKTPAKAPKAKAKTKPKAGTRS